MSNSGAPVRTPSAASAAPAPRPLEQLRVGDTWEWRQIDGFTQLESEKSVRTIVKTSGEMQVSDGTQFNTLNEGFDIGPYFGIFYRQHRDAKPWRTWPLTIGKTWTSEIFWKNPAGDEGKTTQDAEVVSFEEVTVPAGTFMAYKIQYRGSYRNFNGATGKQDDTFWYSPEVFADVKQVREDRNNRTLRTQRYTRELVSFTRGAP